MSELSYLEKLLDGVKVEWKTLEKVLKRTKGTKITAGQMKALHKDNAPLKLFAGGKTVAFVDFKDIPEKDINREPSIIVKSRGIIEFEYYDKPFSHKNEMWSYHSNNDAISIKYIYYFLKINEGYFQKIGGKMQMPQIATPDTDKFEVPIPCPDNPEKSLAIQSEIVRILDKFTALTAELTAELNMRKKQYNYYRDQLLSFKDGEVEWKTLGEIGEFIRGKRFTKADYVEDGGISVIHYGEIYTRYGVYTTHSLSQVRADMAASLRYAKHGDVVITDVGETVEDVGKAVAWLGDDDIAIHDHCYAFRHSLNPKFISYYMQTDSFISEKAKYVARTKVNTLLINGFSKIMIPVPYPKDHEKSLKEQARIVEILDKFDTLTNSITEGLPREIELRQKQYEYYRDLLFSFPKPETVSN
ncbi:TPA: restriction endonuclease subunit S [Escherichia coli]|jgi:type I restriction enzyme S subunit|uniref:Restriction endonuclease subunit S n=3 Tax=Enterobacteriaceae TaxID=543 RepID=A0A345X098_ECOLX|nr:MULTISPECIES: restriction endonuclease subunit S [Enterobacteriaceae]EAA9172233.1 restriction endonuclease subunit S [Salmonella enterica subsp. enterica serovar Senftenberg]EJO6002772.1 restriction endonuclease subunit S [Salmonella enterica]HCL1685533.1 restriction endonuclease subunit S [Salmonella enterica subsp. enterica serovar Typhimurium]AXJ99351.1 Type I restriction-modification system, specificity subunit S [Escherichia coli]EBN0017038.1 restriction endonuclease subunit S [Salmone